MDWQCYSLYGILDEDLTRYPHAIRSRLWNWDSGRSRSCMARQMQAGELENLGSNDTAPDSHHRIPAHWPEAYAKFASAGLQDHRIIDANRELALIEQPEYKRRWNLSTWEEMQQTALKNWLLDRIEANPIWHEGMRCAFRAASYATLWHEMPTGSQSRRSIAATQSEENLDELVVQLVIREAVPFLPALRYTETGPRKRKQWEDVWDAAAQRRCG